jgi:hypothetical protein
MLFIVIRVSLFGEKWICPAWPLPGMGEYAVYRAFQRLYNRAILKKLSDSCPRNAAKLGVELLEENVLLEKSLAEVVFSLEAQNFFFSLASSI